MRGGIREPGNPVESWPPGELIGGNIEQPDRYRQRESGYRPGVPPLVDSGADSQPFRRFCQC